MSDFTQVFRDDFNGSSLDYGTWRAQYSGQYHNGMFRWDPSQLEVGGGVLTIATEREGGSWMSGGLSTIPDGQTYGSYEFRARMDAGQGTAGVILLWPSSNQWTDEVDIVETHQADRQGFAFTNHGHPNVTEYVDVDVSQWHTYRLDWTPGELTLYVDGQQRSRITTDVPDQQMSFAMQGHVLADSEWWYGGGPDGSTPDRVELEVDWVRVSAWTPGQGSDAGSTQPASQPAAAAPAAEPAPAAAEPDHASGHATDHASGHATDHASGHATDHASDPWVAFMVNGQVDWAAAAAQVQANYEATGQWFI